MPQMTLMPVEIAAASLAWMALWLTALSLWVSRLRLRHRVSMGDGGHRDLRVAIRAHGNTLEQTTLYGLLALSYAALPAASGHWLAGCALAFAAARLVHAGGLFGRRLAVRQVAHGLTLAVQLGLAGLIGRAM